MKRRQTGYPEQQRHSSLSNCPPFYISSTPVRVFAAAYFHLEIFYCFLAQMELTIGKIFIDFEHHNENFAMDVSYN